MLLVALVNYHRTQMFQESINFKERTSNVLSLLHNDFETNLFSVHSKYIIRNRSRVRGALLKKFVLY